MPEHTPLRCADRAAEILPEAPEKFARGGLPVPRAGACDLLGGKEIALAKYPRLLRAAGTSKKNVHASRFFPRSLPGDPRLAPLLSGPKNRAMLP